jgi:CBS domain-containing protein
VAASRAPSRIFVSHLAGQAVFDQDGDQVGRIRDVIVALRDSGERPRVLGLLIEVTGRRRVFLPMTRVNIVEDGRAVTTGLINMRRFQQRPGESLLLAELADRSVRLASDGTPVHVVDVAMEQDASRDWEVSRLFVRRPGKGLRRRGETSVEDWEAVTGFLHEEGAAPAATALSVAFEKLRPADLARAVRELAPKRRAEMVATLDDERLADVLQELPEEDQAEILDRLGAERAADVLEAMEPDDAADLLGDLPTEHAERLLGLMEPHEAAPVRRLLVYSDDTAGGIMTSEPLVLPPDATVADALARIRIPQLSPAHASQVYVCRPPLETPTGRYLGIAHFQRLLREPPSTRVGAALDTGIHPLRPEQPLADVTSFMATYNLVAAPVVDDAGHLIGAVTVDDVLDHVLPADWREQDMLSESSTAVHGPDESDGWGPDGDRESDGALGASGESGHDE